MIAEESARWPGISEGKDQPRRTQRRTEDQRLDFLIPLWPCVSSVVKRCLSLVDGHVAIWVLRPDVLGARTNQAVVVELLDHVRCPAGDARYSEDRRE